MPGLLQAGWADARVTAAQVVEPVTAGRVHKRLVEPATAGLVHMQVDEQSLVAFAHARAALRER